MSRFIKAKPVDMARKTSPFVGKDTLKIYIKRYTPEALFKAEIKKDGTADLTKLIQLKDEVRREKGDYTKVFRSPENRKRRASLSPQAAHLLNWIMDSTDTGMNYVTINVKSYINESARVTKEGKPIKLSRNTYKLIIDELCDKGFISKTSKAEVYFINPSIFFNGSRPKAFPENIEYI